MTLATFILTHRRPDRVSTLRSAHNHGFGGEHLYLLVDTDDPTLPEYRERFGDKVLTFDKADYAGTFDTGDQGTDRATPVYARNASIEMAREMGYSHLLQLDDDYYFFGYRWVVGDSLKSSIMRDWDEAARRTVDFLDASGADMVAWSQGGDHFGPWNARRGLSRKAMNAMFIRTDTDLRFVGTLNDDVNTYVTHGARGMLLFTVMRIKFDQKPTQSNEGGMTGIYLRNGTYVKSFYSVMMAPSAVKVRVLNSPDEPRIHHRVRWDNAVPKIISDRYQKAR